MPGNWDVISGYFMGGNRGVPPDAFDPTTSYQLKLPFQRAYTDTANATRVIPEVESLTAPLGFGEIILAGTAFGVGWTIGSTVNKEWLHLGGVGLGTTNGAPARLTKVSWTAPNTSGGRSLRFCFSDGQCSSFLQHQESGTESAGCLPSPGPTWADMDAAWSYMQQFDGMGTFGLLTTYGTGGYSTCSGGTTSRWVDNATAQDVHDHVVIDQPVQPYTGQSSGISTGWGTSTAGTDPAHPPAAFNSGPANPTACYTSASGILTCDGSEPSAGFTIPGINPDPQFTDPNTNQYRCMVDPANFSCPSLSPDGKTYSGGGVTPKDWTMPNDCIGVSPSVCISEIQSAADAANATPPTITEVHLGIEGAIVTEPAGSIVSMSPEGATTGQPTTVTLTENPDPMPLIIPYRLPYEDASAYVARLNAAGFAATLGAPLTDATGDPAYGPSEAVVVQPVEGTRFDPTTDPSPDVTVVPNPTDWPYPDGDPNSPTNPPDGGGGGPPTIPPIVWPDFGNPFDKFPFGIFGWMKSHFDFWTIDGQAPKWTWDLPFNGELTIDLAVMDPIMPELRGLILFGSTMAIVWALAAAFLGLQGIVQNNEPLSSTLSPYADPD